jgi:hypothetical protein
MIMKESLNVFSTVVGISVEIKETNAPSAWEHTLHACKIPQFTQL